MADRVGVASRLGRLLRSLRHDLVRSPGGGLPVRSTRRLAFETTLRAARLAGEAVPPGTHALSTRRLLHRAGGLLAAVTERQEAELRRTEALRVELARLRAENTALRRRPGLEPEAADEADPPPIVHELIDISDRVAGLSDTLEPAVSRWLLDRINGALADAGVAGIREEGPLDPARHAVLGVRATADPDLVDRIAETVRPGYSWRDRILRPQQVIAYVEGDR